MSEVVEEDQSPSLWLTDSDAVKAVFRAALHRSDDFDRWSLLAGWKSPRVRAFLRIVTLPICIANAISNSIRLGSIFVEFLLGSRWDVLAGRRCLSQTA